MIDARSFGPRCPQAPSMLVSPNEEEGEDCLRLNIWSPREPGPHPVMVWIHGGSFSHGSGAHAWYRAQSFAERGIVAVTINYRVGPFGFCDFTALGPGWEESVNLGLADQACALAWVHTNIAAFGGDPQRITLVGESAGAMSVIAHFGMASSAGRFRAAVAQSGAARNFHDPETAEQIAHVVGGVWGLQSLDQAADASMRQQVEQIPAIAAELANRSIHVELPFQPVVGRGVFTSDPCRAPISSVPLLTGVNRDEMRFFAIGALQAEIDPTTVSRRVKRLLRAWGYEGTQDDADAAIALYVGVEGTDMDRWLAMCADAAFFAPMWELVEHRISDQTPTYVYEFAPTLGGLDGSLGAAHALEIPFVFGQLGAPGVEMLIGPIRSELLELSNQMHGAWVSFVQDPYINPTLTWAPYERSQRISWEWNDEGSGVVHDAHAARRRMWMRHVHA
jgi:para-nitrobenzyl esterase